MTPDSVSWSAPLATALRIEWRRPAGWIALAAAVWAGWVLADGPRPMGVPAAVAAGSLLAVAAVGSLPTGVPWGGRQPWVALGGLRLGWPLIGLVLAGSGIAAVSAAATALIALRLRRTASGPGAMSLGLAMAGAAAAAALIAAVIGGSPPVQVVAAAAVWGLVVAGSLLDPAFAAWEWPGGGPLTPAWPRWPEAGRGLAMATSLAGMAGCYFLAPGLAWAYAALALGWFVCLAVPKVLDADPRPAARRLLRATAGRPDAPGTFMRGCRIGGLLAVVLGWPAVVAAVLPADGGRVGSPVAAVVALAIAAGVVSIAAAAAANAGGRVDTPRAVVLSLAALAAVHSAGVEGLAKQPVLPSLPASWGLVVMLIGVERSGPSCETPQPPQSSVSSQKPAGLVEIRRSGAR